MRVFISILICTLLLILIVPACGNEEPARGNEEPVRVPVLDLITMLQDGAIYKIVGYGQRVVAYSHNQLTDYGIDSNKVESWLLGGSIHLLLFMLDVPPGSVEVEIRAPR